MKLKYTFVIRELGDNYVAVAVGESAGKFNGMVRMNRTGRDIFELLKNEVTEDEIVESLMRKYEGDEQNIRQRVSEFVANLSDQNLLA